MDLSAASPLVAVILTGATLLVLAFRVPKSDIVAFLRTIRGLPMDDHQQRDHKP
jgi:hypothetical protein